MNYRIHIDCTIQSALQFLNRTPHITKADLEVCGDVCAYTNQILSNTDNLHRRFA